MMNIVVDYPPNIEEIRKSFDFNEKITVFTYGDNLFNPANRTIPEHLIIHEATHQAQQTEYNGGPAAWWGEYIANPKFRLEQEVEAYSNQFNYIKDTTKDRNAHYQYLHKFAKDLSSKMYGNIVTYSDAVNLIRDSYPHHKNTNIRYD